jgi:hypothetical protein
MIVALVVYIAAAFFPSAPEPRYAVFTEQAECEQAVAQVRASGAFATDCVAVELPKPKAGRAA